MYLNILDRNNYLKSVHVAFNAEEEKEDSMFSENGIVIPNGIDPSSFEVLPAKGSFRSRYPHISDKLIFLFLGRLDITQKSLDVLIQAFAIRVHAGLDAILVLAGPLKVMTTSA